MKNRKLKERYGKRLKFLLGQTVKDRNCSNQVNKPG